MSIEINKQKCIGCKKCGGVCPGSLIVIEKKAEIKHPERCWGCASCIKECPVQAIALYLGEDIGGKGGKMTVKKENTLLHWAIEKPGGEQHTITVDLKDSNKY